MKWYESTLKPSEGQEIIVRDKNNNGKWRYAVGVWTDSRFVMPWTTCDQCGGRCMFTTSNRSDFNGGVNRAIWEWLPLSKFLELK